MWLAVLAIILVGGYAAAVAFVPLWLMERVGSEADR